MFTPCGVNPIWSDVIVEYSGARIGLEASAVGYTITHYAHSGIGGLSFSPPDVRKQL